MSFDVELNDPETEKNLQVDSHSEGGTYAVGGTNQADLNITYNYSKHYYKTLDKDSGLRSLNGRTAGDTIKALTSAVVELGTDRDSDYWEGTPGNAGYALSILLKWAEQHPYGIWRVS